MPHARRRTLRMERLPYRPLWLTWWADRCRGWQSSGHDVIVYFNNDGAGHAVRNARTLQHLTEDLD